MLCSVEPVFAQGGQKTGLSPTVTELGALPRRHGQWSRAEGFTGWHHENHGAQEVQDPRDLPSVEEGEGPPGSEGLVGAYEFELVCEGWEGVGQAAELGRRWKGEKYSVCGV